MESYNLNVNFTKIHEKSLLNLKNLKCYLWAFPVATVGIYVIITVLFCVLKKILVGVIYVSET